MASMWFYGHDLGYWLLLEMTFHSCTDGQVLVCALPSLTPR